MVDCKNALVEANGDEAAAIEILRKKGMATAGKKAGRVTAEGAVGSYIHMGGKVGVLVEINCESDFVSRGEEFQQLVKDVAMHIAAFSPSVLTRDEVDDETVENERRVAEATAKEEGKPEAALARIVEGRVNGYFKENVLLEQPFAKEPKKTVAKVLQEAGADANGFVRFRVGN